MAGVSLGFFTPQMIVKDFSAFCDRIVSLAGIAHRGFPHVRVSLLNGGPIERRIFCGVISGNVPIHTEEPIEGRTSSCFHFIMATRNRPALVTAPASRENMEAILDPDFKKGWGMGCVQLRGGTVVHFDVATHFQSVIGLPLGPGMPEPPEAVYIQVPWEDPAAVQRGLAIAREQIIADGRFSDLVRG